jgi:syntaxin 6
MSAPTMRDPFYSVKDKIQSSIQSLRGDFEEWERLSLKSPDYQSLTKKVRSAITGIKEDLNDLQETIKIVEENRTRFPSIDDRELDSRRDFVTNTRGILNGFDTQIKKAKLKNEAEIRRQVTGKSGQNGGNTSAGGKGGRFGAAMEAEEDREKDEFVSNARTAQAQIEMKQDVILEDMSKVLQRLENLGDDINTELNTHKQMLDELDGEMDEAQGNMTMVLKKIDKLLNTSDKGRLCCIAILFFVALILLITIVYG